MQQDKTASSTAKKPLLTGSSFWIFLGVAVVFGYVFGKDMALRDNAHDAAAQESGLSAERSLFSESYSAVLQGYAANPASSSRT